MAKEEIVPLVTQRAVLDFPQRLTFSGSQGDESGDDPRGADKGREFLQDVAKTDGESILRFGCLEGWVLGCEVGVERGEEVRLG